MSQARLDVLATLERLARENPLIEPHFADLAVGWNDKAQSWTYYDMRINPWGHISRKEAAAFVAYLLDERIEEE